MKEYLIKDLGKVVTGNTPSKKIKEYYDNEDLAFIKPDGIKFNEITPIIKANEYISEKARNKARVVKKNSVLVTCIGNIGKVGIVEINEVAFNQQINAVVTNDLVLPRYLAYNLIANQRRLEAIANAPVVPLINKSQFENFNVQVHEQPSEQNKIVSVLDNLSKTIQSKKAQLVEYDQLIKSRFVEMFESFEKTDLCNIAEIIMGQSPDSAYYNENGVGLPFFQGKADFGAKYTNVSYWTTKPSKTAKKGNVLMSVRAPVGPVNISSVDCCIGRGLCSINAIPNKTNNEFLYNALIAIQDQITAMGTGSTFKAINKSDVYAIQLPLAPISLQNEFANFVEQVDKLKFEVQKSLDETKMLFDSLMQEYFG